MKLLSILVLHLIISGYWCEDIVQVVLPAGEPFSFDCQQDESVYFGRHVNQWSEIEEDGPMFLHLNFKFDYLLKDKILRVSFNSARSEHVGFYACRKATWTSTSMTSIHQLILADVESFYWNYLCHGPIGSCQRTDDISDVNLSQFEVADQTDVELFCCASVTGYRKVDIHMNQIGERKSNIEVNRKQGTDGSWVVCANQRTIVKRLTYVAEQTLTCELLTDDRHHSTLSSVIIITDAMLPEPSSEYRPYLQENDFFKPDVSPMGRSRRKLTKGRKIAIIIGSVLGGLSLLGLIIFLIVMLMRRNKTNLSRTKTKTSNQYSPVKTSERSKHKTADDPKDVEHIYEEPTQLSEEAPVFLRC